MSPLPFVHLDEARRIWLHRTPGARVADYTEIAKPRISLMVLLTVSCGYVLGMESASVSFTLIHACLGIAVVAIGSSATNQWIERETDGRMLRR